MSLKELECEYCTVEISFNEFCNNNGMCDSCYMYTSKNKTKIVKGCDNYLSCGNEANIHVGDGKLCDKCRNKVHEEMKKVFLNSPTGKKALSKFINGLQLALSVERGVNPKNQKNICKKKKK